MGSASPAVVEVAASRPGAAGRWPCTADGRAVLVLVAVPLALFVVPALFGHPAIAGDNAIQNFPLRALTGQDLRQGHLPLWNPYLWSGTPLLGGLNAGSAYPLTLLFAVVPPVAVWVANLVAVYWAAGLGVYALARQYRIRPLAALLAALTYSLAGAMSGQMVHLGVVQGLALVPWLVLAQLRLSWVVSGRQEGRAWPWAVLLAAVLGLVVLTGEPRAMAEAEVVAAAVTLWLVLRPGAGDLRRRAAFLGWSALGAAWGAALSAVQIVPGWSFITASQRASESYWYFGSGSLRPSWTALLLVPDLFGGDGLFHQPTYFNSYNLPEVTGYVGLLPLVAVVALLARSFGRRRDPRSADWSLWLALGGLGLLLAWGAFTPLGHLFADIPLFGKTRLQSRNLAIVDLALAVLLGFWADLALGRRPEAAGLGRRRRWVVVVPAAAAAALCVVAIAVPGRLEQAFGATGAGSGLGRRMTPWFAAELAVALVVGGLVLGWGRLDPRARRRLLAAAVVLDIGLFVLSTSTGLTDGHDVVEPTPTSAAAVLGTSGRFAIFDTTGTDQPLQQIGQPDLNVFTGLPSVQGYGSILSDAYGTATGTHTLDTLNPCSLAAGTFAPLRLSTLLTLPGFVAPALSTGQQAPPAPIPCPGVPVGRRSFFLGQELVVSSADLVAGPPGRPGPGQMRLGLLERDGATAWPAESVRREHGGWRVVLRSPHAAVGVVVRGTPVAATSVVSAADGDRFALDGILQQALAASAWHYTGTWEGYARFGADRVRPPAWIAGGTPGARVHQASTTRWGTTVLDVSSSRSVTVVRSEAFLPGWHVTAVPAGGGPARSLPVERDGLVQAVRVPAGRWWLTFLYRPPGLDVGLAGTGLGLAAMVAVGAWALATRLRRSVGS